MSQTNYSQIDSWAADAQSGDKQAAALLVKSFMPLVLSLSGKALDFEDCRQDLSLAFLEGIYRYAPEKGGFTSFIKRHLHLTFLMRQDGKHRQFTGVSILPSLSFDDETTEGLSLKETIADSAAGPQDYLDMHHKQATYQKMKQGIATLTDKQRMVLHLNVIDGEPLAAIARELHCTPQAVARVRNRALKKLKNMVEQSP